MDEIKIIEDALDELRPFLMNDGGNIEFVKYEDNIVYVNFQGACHHCPMKEITLKDSIEQLIKDKIKDVKEVRLFNEED